MSRQPTRHPSLPVRAANAEARPEVLVELLPPLLLPVLLLLLLLLLLCGPAPLLPATSTSSRTPPALRRRNGRVASYMPTAPC